MNIASAIKNGILCLYALKMPKDFHNGQFVTLDRTSVSRANAKENHHFFPYSLRADFGTDENGINSVVNLAFISQVLNREISNARPSEYIADYALHNPSIHEHLDSHFIDDEAIAAIKEDNFAAFLERRAQVIYDAILQKVQGVGGEESAEAEIDDAGIEYEVPRGDDEMLYA